MQLVLDQLEAPLPQTTALFIRLARRTHQFLPRHAVSHLTLQSPKGVLGSTCKTWAHSNSIPVALGKEWGNTSMDTKQTGEKRLILQVWINFQTGCLLLTERYTCVLPGRRNQETAVGPSFVISHSAGIFAPRQECKTRHWAGLSESQISDSNWDWAKTPRESSLMRNTVANKLPNFLWVLSEIVTIIKPSISVHILELQVVHKMLFYLAISPVWFHIISLLAMVSLGSSGKYRPSSKHFRLCSLLCSIYSLAHSCLCLRNGEVL